MSEGSAPRENGAYHKVFRRPGRPELNWSLRLGILGLALLWVSSPKAQVPGDVAADATGPTGVATLASPSDGSSPLNPIQPAPPPNETRLSEPTPSFYSLQRPKYPPFPVNPFPELPVYWMGENFWIYDDRAVDYDQLAIEARARAEALAAETALLQGPSQQTLLLGGSPLSVLIAKEPTNTFATLTVTNCVYGQQHLVLSKTNLSGSYWNSEFLFTGPSEGVRTFTVPTTLPMKFFEAVELANTNAIVSIQRVADAVEPPGQANQAGYFQVSRSVPDGVSLPALTVCYAIGGTASNGVDYAALSGAVSIPEDWPSVDIDVTPYQDLTNEWDETVTLTLRPTNSYFLDPARTTDTVWVFDTASVTQQFTKVVECSGPVSVEHNPYTNSLIISYNFWTGGVPRNFTNIMANVTGTPWTGIQGLGSDVCPELHFATVKATVSNFVAGDMYFGIGPDAGHSYTRIGWISRDGATTNLSWATLTNATDQETCPVTGALYFDQTGLFGNDLIVVTGDGQYNGGHLWRVKAQPGGASGSRTLFATIPGNPSLEGVITLPNDTQEYGPLAGRIVTSSKHEVSPALPLPLLYAIDVNHSVAAFPVEIVYPEDLDIIPSDANGNCSQDLYCSATLDNCIYRLPKEALAGRGGDILVTDAGEVVGGAKLVVFHWDATSSSFLRKTIFHPGGFGNGLFEHVCFAPISLPALPP